MPTFTDQTGSSVQIRDTPKRIISLVPSQTELLFDLGLDENVMGITKFCVRPQSWFRNKTRVGGTKNVQMDIIHHLQPDLVIANKEENTKEQVEELRNYYPVWVSDVDTLEDAYEMINSVGEITNTIHDSNLMIGRIKLNFKMLLENEFTARNDVRTAAYLIWCKPYMAAGANTFINSMMKLCGFDNIYSSISRYPLITMKELKTSDCQLLLLASEPYPFKENHLKEFQTLLPNTEVILVDGQVFSWYGSRLIYAADYFINLQRQIAHM